MNERTQQCSGRRQMWVGGCMKRLRNTGVGGRDGWEGETTQQCRGRRQRWVSGWVRGLRNVGAEVGE